MKTLHLAPLYSKTNTGAIQEWSIKVQEEIGCALIITTHGQVGGKLQQTSDTITKGKNEGKANATNYWEQAAAEAKAKHTKQLKKGYVTTIEAAEKGEVDAIIEGGIEPMLAPNKSYPKDDELAKRIVFPCMAQPKLDGMRCIAIIENGVCTLWSRTRKLITSVPHVNNDLSLKFPKGKIICDGELYSHAYKDSFEDLLSILRQETPDIEGVYLNAEYHVYDLIESDYCELKPTDQATPFFQRNLALTKFLFDGHIKLVPTQTCTSMEDLVKFFEKCEDEGYEGAMARNMEAPYESGRRSKHLQKMKRFIDKEFKIIGAEDGRGKDSGTVAKFICVTDDGKEFRCRLKATYARRRELMQHPEMWEGKQLTIRFKRWTNDQKPYIGIGQAIRDYE